MTLFQFILIALSVNLLECISVMPAGDNSVTSTDTDPRYLGCADWSASVTEWVQEQLPKVTINNCISVCNEARALYAALKNGNECHCKNGQATLTPTSEHCDVPCRDDGTKLCGGRLAVDIYDAVADRRYLGCFRDMAEPRTLNGFRQDLQSEGDDDDFIEGCVELCANKSFTYAGLQNGAECFCGNGDYDVLGKCNPVSTYQNPATTGSCACTSDCPTQQTNKCGGSFANSMYKTVCKEQGKWGPGCDSKCYCKNGADCKAANGQCPERECAPAWGGPSCNIILKKSVFLVKKDSSESVNEIHVNRNTTALTDGSYTTCEQTTGLKEITIMLSGTYRLHIISVVSSLKCAPNDGLSFTIWPDCPTGGSNCRRQHCYPKVAAAVSQQTTGGTTIDMFKCEFVCELSSLPLYISHVVVGVTENTRICEIENIV